ncbi:YqaJ viral recombinase family protein [Paracidovorax oryzae]|uniref:YqaJ viral recombinase family protein n=1 Tax=Paracidovorax oryzae TaxID=862720 RepID=UPI000304C64E|nr:YqaJ viral recombinase family protein [Paracidovorax oryzae]
MQIVNLTQGSPEWHAHRRNHFNASDAPAMMGCSSYRTRSDLVRELATGIAPEADPAAERRFADGHRFEALARPLAEKIIGEELSPCVGTSGKLSASFDGLTFMGDVAFEHKSLNGRLRAAMVEGCTGADLPREYQVQMEQQTAVSGCERVLFMATKWAEDGTLLERRHCWYMPNPQLRAQILAGWEQLERDIAAHEVPDAPPVKTVAEPVAALPAVFAQVTGSIALKDNLPEYEVALRDFIEHRLITQPESDQDFANLDLQIKALKGAEAALDASEEQALSQAEMLSAFKRQKDMLHKLTRDTRLAAEKLLTAEKERIKLAQVQRGQKAFSEHVAALNTRLGERYMPAVPTDFPGAIKGKRTVDSLRDAVDSELARAKISANEIADRIQANMQTLAAAGDAAQFPDAAQLVLKAPDDLRAVIAHRAAEAERKLEEQRARIRREEQERADAEAREKLIQAEAQAQEGIAAAREEEALPGPLLNDLSALARDLRNDGVAVIDARRAIGNAQASSAAAPEAMTCCENGSPGGICQECAQTSAAFSADMRPRVKCDGDHGGPTCADPECWNGPTITLGQINALLAPIKLDAAGLEALGFATTRVKAAVHLPAAHFPKLCRAVAGRALAAIEKGIPA